MWTTNDTSWRRTSSWRQIPIECHSRLLHRQLHSVGDWQHLLRVRKCKASIQWTLAFFINVICLLQHVEHWALLESFVYNLVHCPSRFPTSQHVFSNCFYRGIWNEHQTKPPPHPSFPFAVTTLATFSPSKHTSPSTPLPHTHNIYELPIFSLASNPLNFNSSNSSFPTLFDVSFGDDPRGEVSTRLTITLSCAPLSKMGDL